MSSIPNIPNIEDKKKESVQDYKDLSNTQKFAINMMNRISELKSEKDVGIDKVKERTMIDEVIKLFSYYGEYPISNDEENLMIREYGKDWRKIILP